jgi:predicted dehydrogenase
MATRHEKLGVAIHGAGEVAYAHAASWKKNPHTEIVSVSSRSRASAAALASKLNLECEVYDRYEDVLANERVDIVNISGPNHVHAEQAIAAAQSGRHLLVEKPIAISEDDNIALRQAVAENGVKSVVSFVLRWNPMFENIKSMLADGLIGRLFYVEVDYWHGLNRSYHGWQWASKRSTGGSAMLMGGCHAVDAVRWFAGQEVVEVSAFGNNCKGNYEYDANVVATLKFADGSIGKTSVLFDAVIPYSFNIDLLGSEGSIRDNRFWSPGRLPGQTDWINVPTIQPDSADVNHHPFDAQINHFVDCIRDNRESHCNVEDAFRTHEVCLAIDRSVQLGGQPVALPLA